MMSILRLQSDGRLSFTPAKRERLLHRCYVADASLKDALKQDADVQVKYEPSPGFAAGFQLSTQSPCLIDN